MKKNSGPVLGDLAKSFEQQVKFIVPQEKKPKFPFTKDNLFLFPFQTDLVKIHVHVHVEVSVSFWALGAARFFVTDTGII